MMTGFNEYICQFCNIICRKKDFKKPFRRWHLCPKCRTWFLVNGKGRVFHTQLICQIEKNAYNLIIDFENQYTQLNYVKEPKVWQAKVIFKINEIINITPQQLPSKLKTWILFS